LTPQGDADDLAALLERHKPLLRYDSQGSFYADSARTMPERSGTRGAANRLLRANGDVIATAARTGTKTQLTLAFLAARRYGDGTNVENGDHLDAVGRDYVLQARELHAIPDYADRIHGHVATDDKQRLWLQYWFFYYYNDKAFLGVGLHEGDWEMVQIGLDGEGKPEAMTFAQHAHGERCSWGQVEKHGGQRPVVYVARGSQASYPRAGRHRAPIVSDNADGKGRTVSPKLELLDQRQSRWVGWQGRWGSTRARSIAESDSPKGPKQHGQWTRPAEFHADAVEKLELQGMVQGQPELRVAPAPRIRAERVGNRAIVHFAFPSAKRGESPATQIVVSVDSPDDELPPATYSFPVAAPKGEIEHPLALEDRRYVVRASGFNREAVGSETVEVPLRRASSRRRR
jgi:Vacuolar protein sorting-associated protein 62